MGKRREFGELELGILKIVREKTSVTIKQVVQALGSSRYTTVLTVMGRLLKKEEVCRQKAGRTYEYSLSDIGRTKSLSLLWRIKQRVFGGNSASMVSYLLGSSEKVSMHELKEIEQLLKKRLK